MDDHRPALQGTELGLQVYLPLFCYPCPIIPRTKKFPGVLYLPKEISEVEALIGVPPKAKTRENVRPQRLPVNLLPPSSRLKLTLSKWKTCHLSSVIS